MTSTRKPIRIVDQPCGSGKTTKLLQSFNPKYKYLVVVPLLSEVKRVIKGACVPFVEPKDASGTKRESLETHLDEGLNIVTTHAMYQRVACLARSGKLEDYHIIIDEVPDTCASVAGVTTTSFQEFYLGRGYATLSPDNRILATEKWMNDCDNTSDTLSPELFKLANAGMLHLVSGKFFMWALPIELLTKASSFTVYTYMADGSMLVPYLKKLGVDVDKDPPVDLEFRKRAKELIEIRDIPALGKFNLSYTKQTDPNNQKKYGRIVGSALKNIKQRQIIKQDGQSDMSRVMITCAKANWFHNGKSTGDKIKTGHFAKNSRMFDRAQWVANTTRGTNDYIDCTHLIYLYDQYMNTYIKNWLGPNSDTNAQDRYALTELIQWVYRSRVRRGEPIVLYLPSKRMRRLLNTWLDAGASNIEHKVSQQLAA
ncbi:hypothetical protein [Pararhizobium sp. IMCC21322]|uniref:hypothetical protein n=1 Tax=Pararhizobium sp. IMCC21322 TaxID=3067903 RepID=UPI002741C0B9|nr:hypothetical protein [Pararhizobium sp. IMCC21322]